MPRRIEDDDAGAPRKSRAALTEIIIEGLFGARNYNLELDPALPTVLTGANGTGKSTILRLVNAVSTGDARTLANAPLDSFELRFSSPPHFTLHRQDTDTWFVAWGEQSGEISVQHPPAGVPRWLDDVIRSSDQLEDEDFEAQVVAAARLRVSAGTETSELRDVIAKYAAMRRQVSPTWLAEIHDDFPVLFITDRRLVVDTVPARRLGRLAGTQVQSSRLAVEAAAADIADQMRRIDSNYARASQDQDRRFPQELIRAMTGGATEPSTDQIEELIEEVNAQRANLNSVGLLDVGERLEPVLEPGALAQPDVRTVIAFFLEATMTKMAVFNEIASRLSLFKEFLEDRFAPKSVVLNRTDGIQFILPGRSDAIRASHLSSGEQQMMVLAYEILFRATPGTLVIVDEPEISLHILWQDRLIHDLSSMGRSNDVQFLMASHSPMLLAAYPELERSLDDVGD